MNSGVRGRPEDALDVRAAVAGIGPEEIRRVLLDDDVDVDRVRVHVTTTGAGDGDHVRAGHDRAGGGDREALPILRP